MKVYKADVLDRITIVLLKQVHGCQGLEEELNELMKEVDYKGPGALAVKLLIQLTMINTAIFINEDEVRAMSEKPELTEKEWAELGKKLLKTHKLNADRSKVKAKISEMSGQRVDPKLNYVKGEWAI